MNEWCEGLSSGTKEKLLRLVRAGGVSDNDPSIVIAAGIQFKIDASVAKIEDSILRLLEVHYKIVGAETGLTKYREHLQQLTDDTKAAIVEAAAYLNVLVKTKETGATVLDAQLQAAMAKVAWRTAACMVGADLLIHLFLTDVH